MGLRGPELRFLANFTNNKVLAYDFCHTSDEAVVMRVSGLGGQTTRPRYQGQRTQK